MEDKNISRILHTSLGSMEGKLTIPVSADRCWDWKNTASVSPQLGQSLLDRGSCEQRKKHHVSQGNLKVFHDAKPGCLK